MVNLRRFGPLIGLFALAVLVLASRLYDVQVREHPTWAREAANLVRSWYIEPYVRGEIRDRDGRLLVRDEEVYELDFVWREFRRGHPLGQVAALRSLILGRPVGLDETRENLAEWAEEIVRLSPASIDAFGRGEALASGTLAVPAVEAGTRRARRRQARAERRGSRAADVHFYLKALLHPSRRTLRSIQEQKGGAGWERPYLELVATLEGASLTRRLMLLREELSRSHEHLEHLAELIEFPDPAADDPDAPRAPVQDRLEPPVDRLVALVEETRREVEDTTADELFRRAAGFGAGRLSADNLARLDLSWLARAMVWDEARLDGWRAARGESWPLRVEDHLAGHAVARAKLAPTAFGPADRVLSSLAYFFNGGRARTFSNSAVPLPWNELEVPVAIGALADRLEEGALLREDARRPLLPVQDPALRAERTATASALLARALVGVPFPRPTVLEGGDATEPLAAAVGKMLRVAASSGRDWRPEDEDPFELVLLAWDECLQQRVAEALARIPGPATFTSGWIDQAAEARAYVVRDRGARPVRLGSEPGYELVRLVTRYPDRYAGFRVRSTTRRVPVAFVDPEAEELVPLADPLIGRVRPPSLMHLLEQRPHERALANLQRKRVLPEEDRETILGHVGATWQEGSSMGSSGLEAYFDHELRGRNGYRESTGLQDRREGSRAPIYEEAIDGSPLRTTLDSELQRAAQRVIDQPDKPPADEERPDRVWHDFPIGALCLITVEGDVLAAASGPSVPSADETGLGPMRGDEQRRSAGDRCLRQPSFHPPGSVFKPFVALWALSEGWISAQHRVDCTTFPGSSYGVHRDGAKVHCHLEWGHHELDLSGALVHSCNAYFAQLGEAYFTGEEMRGMARAFGFDRPTGVRFLGDGDDARPRPRYALLEDARSPGFFTDETSVANEVMLQRLGNGLSYLSVTPLQVARAYAAIATGELPALRLVSSVGDDELPPRSEPLPVSEAALATVRRILRDVPVAGTAKGKALDEASLGFSFACKTGSADYRKGLVPVSPLAALSWHEGDYKSGMRKHGWVAGWFPADDPVAVAVAYVHDTSTTSSHVATHVLSQFLRTEAVRDWAREEGILE